MKKYIPKTLAAMMVLASVSTACVKDKFDYYGYEDQLEGYFPVDSIDSQHTWTLMSNTSTFIQGSVPGAYKLQLLSGNPFEESGVEVLAESFTGSSISKNMTFVSAPHISSVYVAVLDEDGNYLSLTKGKVGGEITLDNDVPSGTANSITPQEIFYGYEADYPNPGDWDYNDVVLSLSKELTSETTVDVHVTLWAVGYLTQIGAAMRWVGQQYDQVKDKVKVTSETSFMTTPEVSCTFFTGEWSDFQKSRSGEFVINLFDDAHIAIFHLAEDGSAYRRYFNTYNTITSSNGAAKQPAKTVTYTFTFDNEYEARNFSLDELDPFIIVQYGTSGSNFWEVHSYPYKLSEVLFSYYGGAASSYNNGFSWAVAIPYTHFLWPEEATPIGQRKQSIVAGAYQESAHSFGEWILNRNTARDWYLYPASGAVYNR